MEMHYALSIRQPWAWAIMHAGKDIENRTWWPAKRVIGKTILIHTGKKADAEDWDSVADICGIRPPPRLPLGAFVGHVRLVRAVSVDQLPDNPWAFGPVCFVLADQQPLREPLPSRGQLGFWQVPTTLVDSRR
jgi:hypothetical protein